MKTGAKEGETVHMFSAEQLPVKKALIDEFGVFNKFFTSTPTASTPNHLFAQSVRRLVVPHRNARRTQCDTNGVYP